MNCKEFNKNLPDMFDSRPGPLRDEMLEHMEACAQCSQIFESWRGTVERLTPSARVTPSSEFKERIMHHSSDLGSPAGAKGAKTGNSFKRWQKALFAAAAVLLAGFSFSIFYPAVFSSGDPKPEDPQQFLGMVTKAMAAQQELVYSGGVTYLAVEHVLPAVSDPSTARSRWFSLTSIRPDGTLQSNRVMMSARPNQPYEVKEELWLDYEGGRFSHVISFEGEVLFANSFDGTNINTISVETEGNLISFPAAPEFSLPERLPQRLGMLAEWDSLLSTNYVEQHKRMSLTGEQILESGERVRILETKGLPDPSGKINYSHFRRIRISDNTLAETEFISRGETSILTRYSQPEKVLPHESPWKLVGLQTVPDPVRELYGLSLEMDVIRTGVTREEILELVEFPVCDFDSNPAWTDSASIYFIRMFFSLAGHTTIVYKAAPGGKHVVLSLAEYWSHLAKMFKVSESDPLYISSGGFKLYSRGEKSKWSANIAITASSGVHGDQPSEDRTAYYIEMPDGTWCQLAINGTLSDSELHALVDKLVMLSSKIPPIS